MSEGGWERSQSSQSTTLPFACLMPAHIADGRPRSFILLMSLIFLFFLRKSEAIFQVPSGLLSSTTIISCRCLPQYFEVSLIRAAMFSISLYVGSITEILYILSFFAMSFFAIVDYSFFFIA